MKTNGAAIRALRKARGWSVRHLAHLAEMHPSHLSRLERGLRGASEGALTGIASALDVPRDAITRE
ncbi:helix-turn-helix domain-containing protein [Streptomyces sp. NPDC057540]|uniref:helix-turn-helix domain-containing protein n=1 Tax=Streptomyces sp. NPDC057540 TaxID=3346160 RepID=UPI003677B052